MFQFRFCCEECIFDRILKAFHWGSLVGCWRDARARELKDQANRALFPLSSRVLIIPYCWWGFWLWSFFSAISKYRFTEACKTCTIWVAMDFVTKLKEMAGFQLDGASSQFFGRLSLLPIVDVCCAKLGSAFKFFQSIMRWILHPTINLNANWCNKWRNFDRLHAVYDSQRWHQMLRTRFWVIIYKTEDWRVREIWAH